jgi:nicotinate-nucleotide adenylyltransferase
MCRLALEACDGVEVSDMELSRGGKSYTIDTLRALCTAYPDDELILLMGGDSFLTIKSWRCADEILRLATIAAIARRAGEENALLAQSEQLNRQGAHTVVVSCPEPMEVSSTAYRQDDSDEIPPAVADYIAQNGLYGHEIKIPVDLDELTAYLREHLSQKRFTHTLNVASEAIRLAQKYGEDEHLAYLAGLLHDICKEIPKEEQWAMIEREPFAQNEAFRRSPPVWHGFAAAVFARREFSVQNVAILNAVRYHTTGRGRMTRLEEIIYMADLVCAERDYPGVAALRAKTYRSLPAALLESFSFAIGDLPKKGCFVLIDTAEAYNRYLLEAPADRSGNASEQPAT